MVEGHIYKIDFRSLLMMSFEVIPGQILSRKFNENSLIVLEFSLSLHQIKLLGIEFRPEIAIDLHQRL